MGGFLDSAIKAAYAAGAIHKKYFNTDLTIRTKETSFDRVTIADIEAEKTIVTSIKEQYSDHNFLAEENKYVQTDSEYTWVIDPLDGTNNFSHGMPIFCVSIGLQYKNDLIVGVIYDVMRDELFYAEKGKGAFLNKQPIQVTPFQR